MDPKLAVIPAAAGLLVPFYCFTLTAECQIESAVDNRPEIDPGSERPFITPP